MAILAKPETWTRPNLDASRYTPDLTVEEQENVRKALRVLHQRFGSWAAVAETMGVKEQLVMWAGSCKKPSGGIALRVARLAGVLLEDALAGA